MERRHFFQSFGAVATGALAGSAAASPAPSPQTTRHCDKEPRVFFYDDGRHASGLYQFAPPLTPADFTYTVDQLVSSGVDTLIYMAGLEGGVVQYDSKVAPKWGENVDQWVHPIFYRASRLLHQLIADGHDPMELLCRRCHEKGIVFIPSNNVCIVGGDRAASIGYGRTSDFVYNHPQYYVGPDNDARAQRSERFFRPERMSFLHADVRKERFLIFEELLTQYETDGIELDLSIDNEFGPYCRFDQIGQLAPILTEWVRDLRAIAAREEQAQGRRKRIYARIPVGPATVWDSLGFDVATWVQEQLVDGFICLGNHESFLDQQLDLTAIRQVTHNTSCRVLVGLCCNLGRQLESSATPPMIWAAAALAYAQGAEGVGLCDGMWAPNGWPWQAEDYQTLRLLGHPDLLQTADKVYLARSYARNGQKEGMSPPAGPVLPLPLTPGKALELSLSIADDLPQFHDQGRVASVRLRVRLTNFEHTLDEVSVSLNGRNLPESLERRIDLHFRVLKLGAINPYGYVLEYLLPLGEYPKQGQNVVRVELVKRDPLMKPPVEVYDVDCSIEYRLHRHFESRPIDY